MYEYTDFYDEAERGGVDGRELLLSRKEVVEILKSHGHSLPAEWLVYFSESGLLCQCRYPAVSLLRWLNY